MCTIGKILLFCRLYILLFVIVVVVIVRENIFKRLGTLLRHLLLDVSLWRIVVGILRCGVVRFSELMFW